MGSFANSLHVKSSDADRVASSLAEILTEAGWRPTERIPDADARWGARPMLRGVRVSAPREGWISILDTDIEGAQLLASSLAQKLATHSIFFFVNDSDAWSYLLADASGAVSEFDSTPKEDGDFDDESLENLTALAERAAKLRQLMSDPAQAQKVQQLGEQLLAEAPPEIRELQARMQQTGRLAPADMQRYHAWSVEQMPRYMDQLNELLGLPEYQLPPKQKSKKKPKRKLTKAQKTARQKRLDELRPLFAPGVSDDDVLGVLDKQAVFAEEVLSEFLPLLGIADFYANLSYRYFDEAGAEELAAHSIHFIHHLRFETNTPPLRVVS